MIGYVPVCKATTSHTRQRIWKVRGGSRKKKSAIVPSPPSVPTPLAAAAVAAPGPLCAPPPVAPSPAASPDATPSSPLPPLALLPSVPTPLVAAAVAAPGPLYVPPVAPSPPAASPDATPSTPLPAAVLGASPSCSALLAEIEALKAENELLAEIGALKAENKRLREERRPVWREPAVLNEGRWSDDEDALLLEAYKATSNGTAPFWTITAANRVGTRMPTQCRGRMLVLLAAFQRGIEAEAGGGARAAVALPSRPRAPPRPKYVEPSLQDFRDKRVVISGDLPATKEQLTDVLVELLHVEAVTGSTSSKTNYVIGYKDSGHDNVTKAGNRLVDPDYFMSLLEEDAIERATAASAERLKARPIRWCDDGLTPQALRGKGVARTGGVSGLDRHQVCAAIQRLGATVHCSVTAETDFLVYGSRAGGKVKAARAHGVPCIPEAVFRDLLSAASAPAPAPCAVAAPSPRRRALAENGPHDEPAAKRHC